MKKYLFPLLFCLLSSPLFAQLDFAKGFGGQIGLSFNLGTHFNRIGVMAKFFYHYEYVQANVQICGFYNARSFPVGTPSWEGQLRIGVVGAFGIKDSVHYSPFINEISNQTSRPFSVGYSYNFYLDDQKTSQLSGTFGFGIYGFSLVMENDFLAFLNEDKYRSGAIGVYYRINNTQIGLNQISWTADPYEEGTSKVTDNKQFPAKYGYRSMKGVRYGAHSVGALALQVEHSIGYGQYLAAAIGIDADQIRNFMQNKLVHDSFMLKNPHVPMVDSEGNQFLYEEGQKIRTPKFFFQVMANNTALY